jgi:signal transduction histidine kinase
MSPERPDGGLPRPPYEPLRERLLGFAATLRSAGDTAHAGELETLIEEWWGSQLEWMDELGNRLRLYHEINNALVGVRGNAQLLLLGPHGQDPDVRQRMEIVIRESTRIKEAANRLREVREDLPGAPGASRAA